MRASRATLEHIVGPSEPKRSERRLRRAARSAAPVWVPYGAASAPASDNAPMPRRPETLLLAGDPPSLGLDSTRPSAQGAWVCSEVMPTWSAQRRTPRRWPEPGGGIEDPRG